MSLSKVNIDALIQQTTETYIRHSDYNTLRDSCLILSAIPSVTETIGIELHRCLEFDKQDASSQLATAARKKQFQDDADEAQHDLKEAQHDRQTATQSNIEWASTQTQIRLNELAMRGDEENIHRMRSLISGIEQQIVQHSHQHTEKTSHQHGHQEQSHQHGHQEQSHQHGHQEQSHQHGHQEQSHQHGHQEQSHQHGHQEQSHQHGHQEQSHQHGHQESALEIRKRALSRELSVLQNHLSQKQSVHAQLLSHAQDLNLTLTVHLVRKEALRNDRALARSAREQARLGNDPGLIQLSQSSRVTLQQSIVSAHDKLQGKFNQLMKTVNDTSYQTFLTSLEIRLQSLSNVNFHEKEALTQIIQFMREYLKTKDIESKERIARNAADGVKENLVQELRQQKNLVDRLEKSNPELTSQNIQLTQANQELQATIQERQNYRNKLLKIGLFGIPATGAAIGAGFLAMNMLPLMLSLTPLFFTPAALIGLVTLSLLIATLVYTVKNNIDSNQLKQNTETMEQNQTTISEQSGKINSLKQQVLPQLQRQISASEQTVNQYDKHISQLQQQADLQLNNAKKVHVTSASNQAFFGAPPPYSSISVPDFRPSAPPLVEETDGTTNTLSFQ
jgi:hypothetical protein